MFFYELVSTEHKKKKIFEIPRNCIWQNPFRILPTILVPKKTVSSFTNVDYMAASIGKRLVILVSTIRSNKQVFSVYQYQHVHSESGCVQYARHVKTNFYKMSQECRRKRSIIGNTVRTY